MRLPHPGTPFACLSRGKGSPFIDVHASGCLVQAHWEGLNFRELDVESALGCLDQPHQAMA